MKNIYLQQILSDQFLSQEEKDIIVGSLLGDATVSSGSDSKKTAIFTIGQGIIHKEYLNHLHSKLKKINNWASTNR